MVVKETAQCTLPAIVVLIEGGFTRKPGSWDRIMTSCGVCHAPQHGKHDIEAGRSSILSLQMVAAFHATVQSTLIICFNVMKLLNVLNC
jgi:hypothetical protein